MALILLRMACSEAEVERVFTRLRHLFGNHSRHSQGDLVELRLTIMMNNVSLKRVSIISSPNFAKETGIRAFLACTKRLKWVTKHTDE
jgi:hypothetical protein